MRFDPVEGDGRVLPQDRLTEARHGNHLQRLARQGACAMDAQAVSQA